MEKFRNNTQTRDTNPCLPSICSEEGVSCIVTMNNSQISSITSPCPNNMSNTLPLTQTLTITYQDKTRPICKRRTQ